MVDNVYNFLFASGSTPGILYGLPKVHKAGAPIRPILSAINTFNYNLTKFKLTTNQYIYKKYSFVKELMEMNIPLPIV